MGDKLLIGKKIKRLRNRLGLTQDKLAEQVNINPKYLSNIERGLENPTLDRLLRLAISLKVELWEMLLPDKELSSDALKKKIKNLGVYSENNPKTLNFYKKQGFQIGRLIRRCDKKLK